MRIFCQPTAGKNTAYRAAYGWIAPRQNSSPMSPFANTACVVSFINCMIPFIQLTNSAHSNASSSWISCCPLDEGMQDLCNAKCPVAICNRDEITGWCTPRPGATVADRNPLYESEEYRLGQSALYFLINFIYFILQWMVDQKNSASSTKLVFPNFEKLSIIPGSKKDP